MLDLVRGPVNFNGISTYQNQIVDSVIKDFDVDARRHCITRFQ